MTALQHVQELDQSADVYLYELKGFRTSNPNETFRFCNQSGVAFGGSWNALACSHNAIEITSTGTQPRIEITISDAAGTVGSLLNEIDAIEGAKLRIIRTKAKYLDSGPLASTTNGILQRSDMVISRVSNFIPGEAIVCEASSPLDMGGGETSCPSRCALNKCSWVYKSTECSYAGSAMFDLSNNPVIGDPSQDKCAKTLSACKARNNTLFFGGFPSLQRR
jgi:lambda family phage minor tail protein L